MTEAQPKKRGIIAALRARLRGLSPARRALMAAGICALIAAGFFALRPSDGPQGPAPQTLKKAMWGSTQLPNGKSLFPTYRDLGVGIYQSQVHWDQIAPTRPADPTNPRDPAYIWPAGLAKAIKEAEGYGITTMLMPIGAPKWANGGKDWFWAPKVPAEFGDFTAALGKRYPSVHLWMIWGEPNRAPNFQPLTPAVKRSGPLNRAQQVAPRLYAQMVDAAYVGLKGVNRANKVIAGNTFTSAGPDAIYPYQWIRYMVLPDGSRPRMDMWGHNPYGFRKPALDHPSNRPGTVQWGDLNRLGEELDRAFPGPPLKLYLSEWGVPIGFEDKDLLYDLPVDEGKEWIRAGFKIARDWDRVYTLGWVHLLDTDRSSQGLLTPDGTPKPSYDIYKGS